MPPSPAKSTFEGVFVTSRASPTLTRSSSKRTAAAVPGIEVTPPAKRVKTSQSGSTGTSTSRGAVVVASSSSRSTRQSGSAAEVRWTPTRISVPRARDTSGPSVEAPRASTSNISSNTIRRNAPCASENPLSSDDEIAIPVSSTRARRTVQATRNDSAKATVSSSTSMRPRMPALPGQRTSSKKKAAISDLMSRKAPVLPDEDEEEEIAAKTKLSVEARDTRHDGVPAEAGLPARREKATANEAESDGQAMDVDDHAVDTSLSLGSTREASPEAGPSAPADLAQITPSKKGRPSTHLSTPTLSAKKRTPTKAVKATEVVVPDFLAPSVQKSSADAIISEERPVSPAAQWLPDRSYPKDDILRVLHDVLWRLSSPCQTLPLEQALQPSDPSFRSWLTELPYMSEGHKAAEKDVRNTLNRTIREGEGNCLLLVGERGIGKTAIIDRSLKALEAGYGADGFLVVRLSGLVQRDDKGALKEVARQLCSNAYVEEVDNESASSFTSNANILSSLLAILEPGPSDDPAETAQKVKPLIFIIDEFDLFAHHSVRQSFLYCLLDCVQGGFRRGGMAVLGLSARADCIETLEKRVKSRCQSRVHHLLPAEEVHTGLALTVKQAMSLPEELTGDDVSADWNASVEAFFSDKNVQMQLTCMDELRGLDADRRLFDIMTLLVLTILAKARSAPGEVSSTLFRLGSADLLPYIQLPERSIPADLSASEVAMLIASKHLVEEERPFNFVIAYDRYSDHCKRAAASGSSSTRAFARGLCLKAFERLKKLGLVKDIAPGPKVSAGGSSIFRLCRLIPWSHAIDEAVKQRKDIPQHLVKWCKAWSD